MQKGLHSAISVFKGKISTRNLNGSVKTPAKMANPGDHIIILHVDDGEQWANFFSKLLMEHNYNIRSVLLNMLSVLTSDLNADIARLCSEADQASGGNDSLGDSGIGSRMIVGSNTPDTDYSDNSTTRVVILSPETLTSEIFPFSVRLLNPKRTVFLFLGVNHEEVRAFFGSESSFVFDCQCCHIHTEYSSVRDALVQIIQVYEYQSDTSSVYEDDENPYENPPFPRQANKIDVMVTKDLSGKDREVYFLLERTAEGEMTVVLENCSLDELPVTCVCDKLCKFTLPDHIKGEIFFRVQSGSHVIGEDSVLALTELDRMKIILDKQVNPLSLIASALGLLSDDFDSIDTALALKLKQLASIETLHNIFLPDNSLDGPLSEGRSDVMYPSLLHFAADWNFQKFCAELLHYPCMLDAALTENKNGDDPRSIAFNKGFLSLEADIIKFVDQLSVENDIYILPAAVDNHSHLPPPPKPHTVGASVGYVNIIERRPSSSSNGTYIHMGRYQKPDGTRSHMSEPGTISPASPASDNVFTTMYTFTDGLDQIDQRMFSTGDSSDHPSDLAIGGILAPPKAKKVLGMTENDIQTPKSSTLSKIYSRTENPGATPRTISHALRYNPNSNIFSNRDHSAVSPTQHRVHDYFPKQKQSKLSTFFGKFKSQRSASEGDNVYAPATGVKKSPSARMDKSKKKYVEVTIQERDSGSYSDEENGKKLANSARKSTRPREFKERDKPMTRQRPLSKRIQLASQERVQDTPRVPTANRRSGFTSFIEPF